MDEFIFWWIFIFIIAIWIIILLLAKKRKKWLSEEKIAYYKKEIKKCNYSSASEKILKYDKILNHILKDFWYEWSIWDQLKAKPAILNSNLQEIWKLHKVRNQIAHELVQLSEIKLINDAKRYEKELLKILG